jgi:hypothetical protein
MFMLVECSKDAQEAREGFVLPRPGKRFLIPVLSCGAVRTLFQSPNLPPYVENLSFLLLNLSNLRNITFGPDWITYNVLFIQKSVL